jgi:hypothetical protein
MNEHPPQIKMSRGYDSQRWIVEERHWMHIWKVGYTPCVSCRADSRYVATLLDDEGSVTTQEMYCASHAPQSSETYERTGEATDIETDLTFRLGGSYPITLKESEAD